MAGCSQNEEITSGGGLLSDDAVHFTAAIETTPGSRAAGSETRTAAGGDEWAAGDRVGIFMLAAGGVITTVADVLADNAPYAVADPATGVLAPEDGDMYYPMEGGVDFAAYYPYDAQTGGTLAIDAIDQSDPAALDVLWARTDGVVKSTEAVNLAFGHVLSKITFNITLGDGLEDLTGDDATAVSFIGMPASATFDLSDGSLTPGAADEFTAQETGASAGVDATFSALIIPQEAGTAVRKAIFSVGGGTYVWNIPEATAFAAGDHYVYPVTVQKTGVTVGAPIIAEWDQNDHGTTEPQIIIAEGTTGPLSWILIGDGTLTISGEGAMPDYEYFTPAPWGAYGDDIKAIVIENGVTNIGNDAFYSCPSIESVIIPGSIKIIGDGVFFGYTKLASVIIQEGVENIDYAAFYNCTGLKSITIPESMKIIGFQAFNNCSSLVSITIPEGVESIGYSAFSGCTSLKSIIIPSKVKAIEDGLFYDCTRLESVTIPEGVKSIGINTFCGCRSLVSVTIPEGVESIGYSTFMDCSSLESVNIPGGVKNIAFSTFYDCMSLESVTISEGVENIETNAFSGCISLESMTFPASIKNIATYAFLYCANIKSVTVLATKVPSLGSGNFEAIGDVLYVPAESIEDYKKSAWGYSFTTVVDLDGKLASGTDGDLTWTMNIDGTLTISGEGEMPNYDHVDIFPPWSDFAADIKTIVIGENVTNIGARAFNNCTGLISVTIPHGVKSIAAGAFINCAGLESITIPESIESIGNNAFAYCTSLKNINIPDGVQSIEMSTFISCISLESITIPESVESIGNYAFDGCISLESITIPGRVKSIEDFAFCYCERLASVTIPVSVTKIGDFSFAYCDGLTDLWLGWNSNQLGALTLGGDAFYATDKGAITLHVPAGMTTQYEAKGFTGFRDIIEDSNVN